jgi:hypothetical protein
MRRISPSRAPPIIASIGNPGILGGVAVGLFVLLEVNEALDEVFVVLEVTTNRVGFVLSLFGEPTTDMDIGPVYVPTTKLPEILPFVITHVCEAMLLVIPPETKMAHAVSEAENPEPVTTTVVPGGPKLGFSVMVGMDGCAFSWAMFMAFHVTVTMTTTATINGNLFRK